MKIIFVNSVDFSADFENIPLGIMSLATACNALENVTAQVVDFGPLYKTGQLSRQETLDNDLDIMCEYIHNLQPDVVSFYSLCGSYHLSIMLAKRLKAVDSGVVVFLGGPHATLTAQESLTAFSWVDYIGMGEGEMTIGHILNELCHEKPDFTQVEGIAYRNSAGEVIVNPLRTQCNLDDIIPIDYSLVDLSNAKALPIDIGRGCPFNCSYCSTKTFWERKYRLKCADKIIEEIKALIHNYKITHFSFVHDLFTFNNNLVNDFCKKIKDEQLEITWSCSARLDTLTEELLDNMYAAGCRKIFVGIETGSPRIQKKICKNLDLSLIPKLIKEIKKRRFEFTCSFMYGFPDEELDDLLLTLDMLLELWTVGARVVQLHRVTFLPGTQLYEQHKGELLLDEVYTDFTDSSLVNSEALIYIRNHKEIFPHFWSVPSIADQFPLGEVPSILHGA